MNSIKTVLVTGASGGMGSYVIEGLRRRGHRVTATARNEENFRAHVPDREVTFIPYDLGDRSESDLMAYFGSPETIIHLAWDKLKDHKSEAHVSGILEDHKHFLTNLVKNGLRDMNVVGTCYEYGLQSGELTEDMPSEPVIAYGIGKNLLRKYLEGLQSTHSFTLKWLRVFNVFGAGKAGGNLYSHLMKAVNEGAETFNMSGGEQVRDYLSPEEVAELIVQVSLQNKVNGIINCSSGRPVKLKDLVTDFLRRSNIEMRLNLGFYPYLAHEPMSHWGNTEKLRKALAAGAVK
jgi:nucleoside-diphosphate-sugar epimerase